jgi:hypothetical protein
MDDVTSEWPHIQKKVRRGGEFQWTQGLKKRFMFALIQTGLMYRTCARALCKDVLGQASFDKHRSEILGKKYFEAGE